MNIAVDVTPIVDESSIAHRIRGTGFYIKNLKKSLLRFFPKNNYTFFTKGQSIPNNTDIVHYPYFEPFFLTLPVFKKHKTVVTVHDLTPLVFPKEFPYGYKGLLKWFVQRTSLKRVDAIITDSECSKKDIIRFTNIPSSKITVAYLAAGEEFRQVQSKLGSLRKKYRLPEKFVLYVGDVTWNKNLPRLFSAIEKIEIPLVMVGKALIDTNFDRNNYWNKDLIKVQEIAKKNPLVIRLGYLPTEDLVLLYNVATVFVMPSLYEGFGLPILEAMQCGCPVVTTREGSIPEIAGDAAFYVDEYNVESIAHGVEKLFVDRELQRELSQKGLQQVKKFSWKKTVKKTFEVYKGVYEKNY